MIHQPSLFDFAAAYPAGAPKEPEPVGESDIEWRPRAYQVASVEAAIKAFAEHQSTLIQSATGTGKSLMLSMLIEKMHADGRCLVLAHRDELIEQNANKIDLVMGERPAIEKGDLWADLGARRKRVIVSSVQTQIARSSSLSGKPRMTRFNPDDFALLVIDEAHRACAPSYRQVLAHYLQNPRLRVLLVTATPDRGDGQALGKVCQSVAFRYPIAQAVEDGWLAPVRQTVVKVKNLDFSRVRTTAGDLNGKDLAVVMEQEKVLHEIATPTMELAAGRQTLVFCASVAHAERLAEIFCRHKPDSAWMICGKTHPDQRRRLFKDFGRGAFQFLTNVGVATEGTDVPGVQVVAIARPTKSRALYEQMLGRGTRPHESIANRLGRHESAEARRGLIACSPKPFMEVIDFAGNAGRHKLVTAADILGGDYAEKVRERAKKNAAKASAKGVPADIAEMLRFAAEEIAMEESRKARREAEERERRKPIVAEVKYQTREVDPFNLYDVKPPRERKWKGLQPPTQPQIDFLARYGVDASKTSRGEAGRLITELRGRLTAKQASVLIRAGYAASEISDLNPNDASRLIDRVKANGWNRPEGPATAPDVSHLMGATEGVI